MATTVTHLVRAALRGPVDEAGNNVLLFLPLTIDELLDRLTISVVRKEVRGCEDLEAEDYVQRIHELVQRVHAAGRFQSYGPRAAVTAPDEVYRDLFRFLRSCGVQLPERTKSRPPPGPFVPRSVRQFLADNNIAVMVLGENST